MTHQLIQTGIVAPGLVGEIFARTLLARDWLMKPAVPYEFGHGCFAVKEFLESLYGPSVGFDQLPSQLIEAIMNFNHFTEMSDGELESETFQELCPDLLRRSAGLQLRPTQKRYDILLPIYFGKPDEPSRTENC